MDSGITTKPWRPSWIWWARCWSVRRCRHVVFCPRRHCAAYCYIGRRRRVNPLPRDTVANMGADIMLGVNLRARRPAEPVGLAATEPTGRPPAIFDVLSNALELLQRRVAPPPLARPTIEITPRMPDR